MKTQGGVFIGVDVGRRADSGRINGVNT